MSDDVWILGIRMTKFGKHPDKDTVDLASEAALAALAVELAATLDQVLDDIATIQEQARGAAAYRRARWPMLMIAVRGNLSRSSR